MPDDNPVSVIKLTRRFTGWIIVACLLTLVPFLLARLAEALSFPVWMTSSLDILESILVPAALAGAGFLYGRRIRHEHGLSISRSALVAAGGMGLLLLLAAVSIALSALSGDPWPEQVVDLWLAGAAIVALGAGGGALGAWWQRRHPDSEPFKPPALALPVSRESLGLAAAWMFAGYVAAAVAVGGVVMLTGSVLHAIDLVTAGPGGILLAGMLLLPLLIFAFISGQQMCRHHGLSVGQAALAILLGMAAITVVFGVSDRPDVFGTKTAEPERLPHHIALVAIVWALTVAVGVLGARSASPAPKCDQVLEAARTKAQAGAGAGLSNDRD